MSLMPAQSSPLKLSLMVLPPRPLRDIMAQRWHGRGGRLRLRRPRYRAGQSTTRWQPAGGPTLEISPPAGQLEGCGYVISSVSVSDTIFWISLIPMVPPSEAFVSRIVRRRPNVQIACGGHTRALWRFARPHPYRLLELATELGRFTPTR